MKNKILIIIGFSAVLTLSFTFGSVRKSPSVKEDKNQNAEVTTSAPVGGFVSEDKF